MPATLVLGGTRSGKSAFAQAEAEAAARRAGRSPIMIVTAQPLDAEMHQRIERHRADRGVGWTTHEAPHDLVGVIERLQSGDTAVVDCLTLWLSNRMAAEADIEAETETLALAISTCPARLWLVSNEVGWGIVPDNALARRFRDFAGRLHQSLAVTSEYVVMVVAGLPISLKPTGGQEGRSDFAITGGRDPIHG